MFRPPDLATHNSNKYRKIKYLKNTLVGFGALVAKNKLPPKHENTKSHQKRQKQRIFTLREVTSSEITFPILLTPYRHSKMTKTQSEVYSS